MTGCGWLAPGRKRLYTDDTGESYRGLEHANAALTPQVSCTHCVRFPLAHRQRRANALAAAAGDDWLVQESYSVDEALDYWIRVAGSSQATPSPPFTDHHVVPPPCLPLLRTGETGRGPVSARLPSL
ncbi:hypothetical protein CgunFtcFv8_013963 [Champsocephalus gunnari]|uniref:Uncharacterized protein n=1 Tax=Champsocephalus gunnari TaxID=52237 RepID=A0AAN8E2F1_CHAGU|nr:hypothetical protein CgunFtcFv8_013963 [Champsocephalus gunnari]